MIKPDLIIIWPMVYDYPVCRSLICRNRDHFNRVIISFTHNDLCRDYRRWLKGTHPDWIFVDDGGTPDWYDGAINKALAEVNNDYVMFMEQDFLYTTKLLKKVLRKAEERDFVCLDQNRFHFACYITRMEMVNKTSKYFQAIGKYNLDCFDLFCAEMMVNSKDYATLDGLKGYKHLNGLTQNLRLAGENNVSVIYKPKAFKHYLELSLRVDVVQHPEWVKITKEMLKRL